MKHNYNNYSNKESVKEDLKTEKIEVEDQTTINETEKVEVDEPIDPVNKTEPEEVKETFTSGIVTNCKRLHVRLKPSKESESIGIIDSGTAIDVFEKESTETFYKVRVSINLEGYCMKQFDEIVE